MLLQFNITVVLSLGAVAAMMAMSASSFAAGGTGRVMSYQLIGSIPGTGVCVRTHPGLPGSGWACVWYSDQLYKNYSDRFLFRTPVGHSPGCRKVKSMKSRYYFCDHASR
jgi:hypothetical protein